MRRISEIFLTVMLIIVIISSAITLFSSFLLFRSTNITIAQILQDAKEDLQSFDPNGMSPHSQAYIDQLTATSSSGLDANLLSFFFQILSLGMISGGVYLIDKSNKEVNQMKKIADDFGKEADIISMQINSFKFLLDGYSTTISFINKIIIIEHISWSLYFSNSKIEEINYISSSLELLNSFHNHLKIAFTTDILFDNIQFEFLIERLRIIQGNYALKKYKNRLTKHNKLCNDCIELLEENQKKNQKYKRI